MATPAPQPADAREPRTSASARIPGIRASLFWRIYATFVGAVLVFAVLVGLLVWAAISSWNEERVLELVERVEGLGQPIAGAMLRQDHAAVAEAKAALERELDARVTVFPRGKGRHLGPPIPDGHGRDDPGGPATHLAHEHPPTRMELRALRQGQAIVRRHGLMPPTIGLALFETGFAIDKLENADIGEDPSEEDMRALRRERGRFIGVVAIDPKRAPHRGLPLVGLLLLAALAGGAWPLARSLTSRLAKLERSTEALARGELSHRATIDGDAARDEVDRLALSFNAMAERLETLVTGQRTLLANVSHELRTPIARTKVLVEILGERVEIMAEAQRRGEPVATEDLARLERGFEEMQEDLGEVEALIRDLLTSGRLELGRDGALALEDIELAELCEDAALRFEAAVTCEPGLTLRGDRMLLERLLKNLLANARRACPEGALELRAWRDDQGLGIEVEDAGPGIPVDKRTHIFEPFARLDAARARDHGGVGLGLYLCRQVIGAHGGTITAESRRDGGSGARFVIRLPAS